MNLSFSFSFFFLLFFSLCYANTQFWVVLEINTHGFHFQLKWEDFCPCFWYLWSNKSLAHTCKKLKKSQKCFFWMTASSPFIEIEKWSREILANLILNTLLQFINSSSFLKVKVSDEWGLRDGSLTPLYTCTEREGEYSVLLCSSLMWITIRFETYWCPSLSNQSSNRNIPRLPFVTWFF